MKSLRLTLLILAITACGEPESPPEPLPEPAPESAEPARLRRALWILAEGSHRTLEDPTRVDGLLRAAESQGISDLLVQVYRGGRSWYPSQHADEAPYRKLVATGQADSLERLIRGAHERGMRVHAWFNALSLAQNADAPLIRVVGREAVHVDREGRSLLDYPKFDVPVPDRLHTRLGTPGVWLDPAVPGVIEYLELTLDDLIRAAPELDGLHLDFIRHPMALPILPGSRFDGLDFGYGTSSRLRFEQESGRAFRRGDAWDQFRRDRVGEVVQRLKARLPQGWELSAAVLPWADRAYLSSMQDWRYWLEEGWADFVVAMAYMRDDRLLRYVSRGLRGGVGGDRVWIGLGSWLFLDEPARIQDQLFEALRVEPSGVALFSYDAFAERPELLQALRWSEE